jgi:hypothetical protein
MLEGPFTGGCICGSIRYEVNRIFDVIWCHCNRCRRVSGAPALMHAQVPGDAFHDVYRISNGAVVEFWSFSSNQRGDRLVLVLSFTTASPI